MILVKSAYEIVTPESAEQGEASERGWLEEEGVECEDVGEVVKLITRGNAIEPSSSAYHKGIWYSTYPIPNYRTGDYETRSYHLEGLTEEEEREVYAAVTK